MDLPNDFVEFQAAADIRQEVRASCARWLHQTDRVTNDMQGFWHQAYFEVRPLSVSIAIQDDQIESW